jgi:hypothetical protein
MVLGIIVTIGTYSSVSVSGGTYIIAYGPIIFGFIRLVRGLTSLPDRTPDRVRYR